MKARGDSQGAHGAFLVSGGQSCTNLSGVFLLLCPMHLGSHQVELILRPFPTHCLHRPPSALELPAASLPDAPSRAGTAPAFECGRLPPEPFVLHPRWSARQLTRPVLALPRRPRGGNKDLKRPRNSQGHVATEQHSWDLNTVTSDLSADGLDHPPSPVDGGGGYAVFGGQVSAQPGSLSASFLLSEVRLASGQHEIHHR